MRTVPTVAVLALAVALTALGCYESRPSPPAPDLSAWRPDRAPAEAAVAAGRGDYRLLSMMGFAAYTPGIDGRRPWPTVNGNPVDTACIGGSDCVTPEELPVDRTKQAYADRYNGWMADYLAAHPWPPVPPATRPDES